MILMTGLADHDIDVEAMKAGAMDYLVKGRIDSDLLECQGRREIVPVGRSKTVPLNAEV